MTGSNSFLGSVRRAKGDTQLLDGAETDSIGFAQSAIDGARLSNAHFGAANERRYV